MRVMVQPDDGIVPLLTAIRKAKKSIDTTIFRFDRREIEKALTDAVTRGVVVRALIANTNRGGERNLRKLELRLLADGVTVARTADDLIRYHHKIMVVDRETLYLLGFNYTGLDILKSRSFGVETRTRKLVQEALKLFEADLTRQPYAPGDGAFVVSPENSRARLTRFISRARRSLLVYDPEVTDAAMVRLLGERARQGVDVRVLGKVKKPVPGVAVQKYPLGRFHVRAIVRDESRAFVGSQSLRRIYLDERREAGLIVRDRKAVKRIATIFEADWAQTDAGKAAAEPAVEARAS
jgi:cardiolipin synthase